MTALESEVATNVIRVKDDDRKGEYGRGSDHDDAGPDRGAESRERYDRNQEAHATDQQERGERYRKLNERMYTVQL